MMDKPMTLPSLDGLVAPLLDWYACNARVLPWRENTDPYRVWVSEIMLQQTRVEAVIPYYLRFLEALPTVERLADAGEEQLLKLWEGLGYYTRVRNLHKAAQIIRDEQGGRFPDTLAELRKLPGVGEYTAGAVASIAFGLPKPGVDGNVLRVVARFAGDERDIAAPALKADYIRALEAVYPTDRAGDFTQSLMELGAVVCLPNGAPRCGDCPLAGLCRAKADQSQDRIPVKTKKQPRRREEKTVLLLRCGEQVAVRKREDKGLLGGLWEFPNLPGTVTPKEVAAWLEQQGIAALEIRPGRSATHIFTHVEWRMDCYQVECANQGGVFYWITLDQLDREIGLPTAFRQFRGELDG